MTGIWQRITGRGQQVERIVGGCYRERLEQWRTRAEHVRKRTDETVRERVVRNDEHSDHKPEDVSTRVASRIRVPGGGAPAPALKRLRRRVAFACTPRAAPRTAPRPRLPR